MKEKRPEHEETYYTHGFLKLCDSGKAFLHGFKDNEILKHYRENMKKAFEGLKSKSTVEEIISREICKTPGKCRACAHYPFMVTALDEDGERKYYLKCSNKDCNESTLECSTRSRALKGWAAYHACKDAGLHQCEPEQQCEPEKRDTFSSGAVRDKFPYRYDLMSEKVIVNVIDRLVALPECDVQDPDALRLAARELVQALLQKDPEGIANSLTAYVSEKLYIETIAAIYEVVKLYAAALYEGASKYGERNWEKGLPDSNLINHALAHLFGDLSDEGSEDHLSHLVWNALTLVHFHTDVDKNSDDSPTLTSKPIEVNYVAVVCYDNDLTDATVYGFESEGQAVVYIQNEIDKWCADDLCTLSKESKCVKMNKEAYAEAKKELAENKACRIYKTEVVIFNVLNSYNRG